MFILVSRLNKFLKMNLSKFKSLSSKGFTLIELLVVIAVLGVLASVVLVAINPAEQLARGRDSSRLQQVASLGHAVTAYYTAQQGLPVADGSWQDKLISVTGSGDIKAALDNTSMGGTPATCAPNGENGICYKQNTLPDFFVWAGVESNLYKIKAGNGTACASGNIPAFIFDSKVGRAGVGCVNSGSGPASPQTLY